MKIIFSTLNKSKTIIKNGRNVQNPIFFKSKINILGKLKPRTKRIKKKLNLVLKLLKTYDLELCENFYILYKFSRRIKQTSTSATTKSFNIRKKYSHFELKQIHYEMFFYKNTELNSTEFLKINY